VFGQSVPERMRRRAASLCAAALVGSALVASTTDAEADVSSWLFVGTGPSWLKQAHSDLDSRWSMQIETGIGTPPTGWLIIGGLGRAQTHFGRGTDLALLLRTATRGFVSGGWGGALDLGPYRRFWGVGSTGASGSLVLGAPWGVTLNLGGGVGSHDARTYSAVLGIDFARLTVYRTSGQSWWTNPFPPAGGEEAAPR
jgi:hypothetical protein